MRSSETRNQRKADGIAFERGRIVFHLSFRFPNAISCPLFSPSSSPPLPHTRSPCPCLDGDCSRFCAPDEGDKGTSSTEAILAYVCENRQTHLTHGILCAGARRSMNQVMRGRLCVCWDESAREGKRGDSLLLISSFPAQPFPSCQNK